MLSAGPWRLDALEIVAVARFARYDRRHLIEAIREVVESGEIGVGRSDGGGTATAGEDEAAEPRADGATLQPRTFDLAAEATAMAIGRAEASPGIGGSVGKEASAGAGAEVHPPRERQLVAPLTRTKLRLPSTPRVGGWSSSTVPVRGVAGRWSAERRRSGIERRGPSIA
jgi:hypothetical protein